MVLAFDEERILNGFVCLHQAKNYPTLLNGKEDYILGGELTSNFLITAFEMSDFDRNILRHLLALLIFDNFSHNFFLSYLADSLSKYV